MGGRYIIECKWGGYRSSRQRVVHRTVHPASSKHLRAWAEATRAVAYTDGKYLTIQVRDCKPREHVKVLDSYKQLLYDCAHYGVASVEALIAARKGGAS